MRFREKAHIKMLDFPPKPDFSPSLSQVLIARTGAHSGAAVTSNGFLLVAVPVELEEEDVTGEIRVAEMKQAARFAVLNTILLQPHALVTGGQRFSRSARFGEFPRLYKTIDQLGLDQPAEKPPERLNLNGTFLGRIAAVIGQEGALSVLERTEHAPILLVRPQDRSGYGEFLGIRLPWAVLMPLYVGTRDGWGLMDAG